MNPTNKEFCICLIESLQFNAEGIRRSLVIRGWQVDVFTTIKKGHEAIHNAYHAKRLYDCVLHDVGFSGEEIGTYAVKRITEEIPELCVIFISETFTNSDAIMQALGSGASWYISIKGGDKQKGLNDDQCNQILAAIIQKQREIKKIQGDIRNI